MTIKSPVYFRANQFLSRAQVLDELIAFRVADGQGTRESLLEDTSRAIDEAAHNADMKDLIKSSIGVRVYTRWCRPAGAESQLSFTNVEDFHGNSELDFKVSL